MSKFDLRKYLKENKITISKAPEQRMINERFFMGGLVTQKPINGNPFGTTSSVNEGHEIRIDKPSEVTSKRVKAEVEKLAKQGVRSKDIKLVMGFVTSDTKGVTDKFQVLKNHVYFEMNKAKNESVNESKGSRENVKNVIAQKGYGPIFSAIDNSKRDLKRAGYTRGEIQDTLLDMFDIGDPKVLKKIKE